MSLYEMEDKIKDGTYKSGFATIKTSFYSLTLCDGKLCYFFAKFGQNGNVTERKVIERHIEKIGRLNFVGCN